MGMLYFDILPATIRYGFLCLVVKNSKVFEKLSLTLKYIFEKNLTPSIIDLRYKDGAALNYGK